MRTFEDDDGSVLAPNELLPLDNLGRFECWVCPRKPNGDRQRHPDASPSSRPHEKLTAILRHDLLDERLPLLRKSEVNLVRAATERESGRATWLREWLMRDQAIRETARLRGDAAGILTVQREARPRPSRAGE